MFYGEDDDFKTKKEFWYFVGTITGWALVVILVFWSWIVTVMCNDLVEKVQIQDEQIEVFSYDAVRYKQLYEDLYNTYVEPINPINEGGIEND